MPTKYPLYINFIWHMHQPYYKRLDTGEHAMPWVRLHATKDYLDMPLIVEDCPGMKASFNLVPSLIEQIEEFAEGTAREQTLELSRKDAKDLTREEKRFIIANFFQCNHHRMIAPFPAYEDLYSRRGWARTPEELDRAVNYFQTDDMRDLQVWFNLAWVDPFLREKNDFLKRLIQKGSRFSEKEKKELLDICQNINGKVVSAYRRLQNEGVIEVSISPFYHPILPLVYDTNFCQRPRPQCPAPRLRFHHPEDAAWHIEEACAYYKERFGAAPKGMWPSEGSVCPELIPLFKKAGLSWIATDEEILALSLGNKLFARDGHGALHREDAEKLYQPYRATFEDADITVFFRDHYLSDLIGFQYSGWNADNAAANFVSHLKKIKSSLPEGKPYVVSIILDGENCWEFYEADGLPFLRQLYKKIVADPDLKPVTPSEYLAVHPPRHTLKELYTGSWINHDFYIWIGHEDDRQSWERLAQTRRDVMQRIKDPRASLAPEAVQLAKKAIAIAEGSDWNWWFGDDHNSGIDDQFDALYRNHLMQAYKAVGLEIPSRLFVPITSIAITGEYRAPAAFIKPTLDGRVTSYFEWLAAGSYEITSGSMHRSQHTIRSIRFGFDADNFYVRVDPNPEIFKTADKEPLTFILAILEPVPWRFKARLSAEKTEPLRLQCNTESEPGTWTSAFSLDSAAFDKILEMAIPFEKIGLHAGMAINFQIVVQSQDHELERCPSGIPIRMVIPDRDFEETLWKV